jgi:hypothetical protein
MPAFLDARGFPLTVFDLCSADPAVKAGLGDPEVLRDLGERSLLAPGHGDDVAAELRGERFVMISSRMPYSAWPRPDLPVLGMVTFLSVRTNPHHIRCQPNPAAVPLEECSLCPHLHHPWTVHAALDIAARCGHALLTRRDW